MSSETELTSRARPEDIDTLAEPVYAPYARVGNLIEPGTTVLDVGCGNGKIGHYLAARGAVVDGVEPSSSRAAVARRRLRYVSETFVGPGHSDPQLQSTYDLILFMDVVEHLAEPGEILAWAAAKLAPGGAICASIPNSAHLTFRLKMLRGDWTYTPDGGLFDQTHLRFFNPETASRLRPDGLVEGFKMYSSFGRSSPKPLVRMQPKLFAKHIYFEWRNL